MQLTKKTNTKNYRVHVEYAEIIKRKERRGKTRSVAEKKKKTNCKKA